MSEAIVADTSPAGVDVEGGKSYYWCACGRSAKQPFCDGSHKSTSLTPLKFEAPESKKVFLCRCKQSKNPPYCDGSHKSLA